jgi:hypothetical protein
MEKMHDCPDCTHPADNWDVGTILYSEGALWFKSSKTNKLPWQRVYGMLQAGGGYNYGSLCERDAEPTWVAQLTPAQMADLEDIWNTPGRNQS